MLRTLLGSHPDVLSRGEMLTNPIHHALPPQDRSAALLERAEARRATAPWAFVEELAFDPVGKEAVGFKILYESVLRPPFDAVLAGLENDVGVKIIHLKRVNRLRRFASHAAVLRGHGVVNIWDGSAPPVLTPFTLAPAECLADFAHVEALERRFAAMFSRHDVLETTYEALTENGAAALDAVQDFLGVPRRALTARTSRVNAAPLSEVILNYEELRRSFTGTPYARFFDSP
jgi:hypothetical protein